MGRFRFPTISVLNDAPLVVAQYDSDFERRHAELSERLAAERINRVAVFLQLGFEHEDQSLADGLANAVKSFLSDSPFAKVTILCNTPREVERFTERSIQAVFCHQNAFLDESRYPILPLPRVFDAVYLARITPVKRHLLLETMASPKLLLAGAYELEQEHAYAEDVRNRLKAAVILPRFRGIEVSKLLCSSHCGLMLSPREGANFATAEYSLCGLPVVNTPSIGGRELLCPVEFRTDVPADGAAIARAIENWVRNPPDPKAVRKAFLSLAKPHRERLYDLIEEFAGRRPSKLPHKLGLRVPPSSVLRSVAMWTYLRLMTLLSQLRLVAVTLTGGRR